MRGEIPHQASIFSYVDLEARIPKQHPIRKIQRVVDKALAEIKPELDEMHSTVGRPIHSSETTNLHAIIAYNIYNSLRTEAYGALE